MSTTAKEKLYTSHDISGLERRIKKFESIIQILKTVDCTVHAIQSAAAASAQMMDNLLNPIKKQA